MSINYGDIFIDYIEQFTDAGVIDKFAGSTFGLQKTSADAALNPITAPAYAIAAASNNPAAAYSPIRPLNNIVFSNKDRNSINTISEVNTQIITKNSDDIALSKQDIYDIVSTLSVEEISLFSPKIEIYRRVPSYITVDTRNSETSPNKDDLYVLKKLDFVDGWNQIMPDDGYRNRDLLSGDAGMGVAAIVGASWEVQGSSNGLQGGPEIYDYLNKIGASISKFEISFKFDSAATFFGNSQNYDSQLITNFLQDPKAHISEMSDRGIEGNDITRNYSYLMFFGDISDKDNKANLDTNNSEEAHRFVIKVGYEAINHSIDLITNDPTRKEKLLKFNNFLRKYPDYFNLVFKANLADYSFDFATDNSIKLKCIFSGIVQQGSMNELLSYKRKDFNFIKILEKIAIQDDPNRTDGINDAKKQVEENQKLINDYEILARTGCDSEVTKYPGFKDVLKKDLEDSLNNLASLKEKSWSYFLDNVPMHLMQQTPNDDEDVIDLWIANVIDDKPIDMTKSDNFLKNVPKLKTLPNNFAQKAKLSEINVEEIKKAAADNPDSSGTAIAGNTLESGEYSAPTNYPFFFFGDLVNEIIQKFKDYHRQETNSGNTSTGKYDDFVCTMPNITIYKRTLRTSNGYFLFGGPSRVVTINAAYVPIYQPLFRAWVYRNIIAKRREYYFLFDLLNDLKTLLTEAINYKTSEIVSRESVLKSLNGKPLLYSSFYNSSFNINSGVMFATGPSPFIILDKAVPINTPAPTNIQQIFYKINKLSDYASPYKEVNICGYTGETLFETTELLESIYQSDSDDSDKPTKNLTSAGNYSLDMKLGIVHFFIGNQLGLAKNFSFKAGTAPLQIEQQANDETRTTDKLRNIRYNDVEIKLIGGNFFRPTEIIYVHPHHTFGEPFEKNLTMSNILNIGGYYTIMNVNGSFSKDGKYETTLVAKYLVQAHAVANQESCATFASDKLKERFLQYKNTSDFIIDPIVNADRRLIDAIRETDMANLRAISLTSTITAVDAFRRGEYLEALNANIKGNVATNAVIVGKVVLSIGETFDLIEKEE